MRTLKKSLCLVLALVFVLGLCTIGAGAAFEDAKEINYANQVTVMNGLGIVVGDDNDFDGNMEFRPTDNVTRAEAAKMITYMMLGSANAEKLPAGDGGFSDVSADYWAAKYINYCSSKGIIKGLGDGTFAPRANIKGTELATMLLRALGFGVMGEYEGKGWDINAVSDALTKGVFEDSEVVDFALPATREETALYVFNSLFVPVVGYDVDLNFYDELGYTYASRVWKLGIAENVQIEENQATGAVYTVANGINFAIETDLDLIAHEVDVYFRAVAKTDDDKNDYYEAYLVDDLSTVVDPGTYYGDLYKALYTASKDNLNVTEVQVWVNYVYDVDSDVAGLNIGYGLGPAVNTIGDLKGIFTAQNYMSLIGKFILDEDGVLLALMKTNYKVDEVKAIDDEGIQLKNDAYGVADYDPEYAYEGIAKGDYVTVQPVGNIYYLYPTTTQTIDIYERATSFIFIGYYNMYAVAYGSGVGAVTPEGCTPDPKNDIQAGDTVLFYMDYYGKYFAAEILERGTLAGTVFMNNAFVTGSKDIYGVEDTTVYVQCVDAEGEEVIYPLTESFGTTFGTGTAKQGVYKVYLNSDGEATLTAVDANRGIVTKEADKKSYLKLAGDNAFVTSDTAIFYVYGINSDLKITKGSSLTDEAGATYFASYTTLNSTSSLDVVWISTATISPVVVSGSYMYLPANSISSYGRWAAAGGKMVVNSVETSYYTVYLDGVAKHGTFLKGDGVYVDAIPGYATPGFYNYTIDEYNQYALEPVVSVANKLNVYENVALTKGDIFKGKLFVNADGLDLSGVTVLDITSTDDAYAAKSQDGKKYISVGTIAEIEALLNEGAAVRVSYLATIDSNGFDVPTGPIYVLDVEWP